MTCDALADKDAEVNSVDTVALLDEETSVLSVDDGKRTTLDDCMLVKEEEATLLDVICMLEVVADDATLLLSVAVAVQNSCGTTLYPEGTT